MKLNSPCRPARLRTLGVALLAALGLWTQDASAQNSPVGTWDLVLSGGGQAGITKLTFSDAGPGNRSFTGYELLSTKAKPNVDPQEVEASRGGEASRSGLVISSTSTNAPGGNTNLFGFGAVSGPWQYDSLGRIIGYFTEHVGSTTVITQWWNCVQNNFYVVNTNLNGVDYTNGEFAFIYALGCYTNLTPYTNLTMTWTIPTNFSATITVTSPNPPFETTISSQETNAVSFVGKVVPGKRLTMTASTTFGKVTYRGVPSQPVKDLSGDWYGNKKANQQELLQLFTLIPTTLANPFSGVSGLDNLGAFPGIYFTTNGTGPGYTFYGFSMNCVQKKVGFAFLSSKGTNGALSSTFGTLSTSSKATKANTTGVEEPFADITFKANKTVP